MINIIETNLSLDRDGQIRDFQSRIVQADSWRGYCYKYMAYDGKPIAFKAISYLIGDSVGKDRIIKNLKYDMFHLECDIFSEDGFHFKKLAYWCDCNYDAQRK